MHLVNEKNDIALVAHLVNKTFDSAFKLTSELRACNESRQIKQINLLVCKACGHFALGNFNGKTLGNGCFSDARLTDKAGIVFVSP